MARHFRNRPLPDEELPPTPINRDRLREAGQLARYLLPYAFQFAAALVALLLSSLCGLAFPYLVGRLVNNAVADSDAASSLPWYQSVNGIALALTALLGVQAALSFLQSLNRCGSSRYRNAALPTCAGDTYARLIRLRECIHGAGSLDFEVDDLRAGVDLGPQGCSRKATVGSRQFRSVQGRRLGLVYLPGAFPLTRSN